MSNVMNRELQPQDFAPALALEDAHGLMRPSRSYWQDAWWRLRRNRRALLSLWIVLGLLAFALLGPALWRVDPARQDIDQISQAPGADRSAIIVAPYQPWNGLAMADAPMQTGVLGLGDAPSSQAVRVLWDALPGASGYRLYRNNYPIDEEGAFGLPIVDVMASGGGHYEDRLNLRPGTYYYTLVALDEFGGLTQRFETLTVEVPRVITVEEVRQRALVPDNQELAPGDTVYLAFHPLGTDYLGRDVLARLMSGARVSLFIGIVAPLLYVLLGVVYGSAAGFVGGRLDQVMMRFADFVVALPFLLFMILFQVVFGLGPGQSGIIPMMVALVLLQWPATARLVRGQILQIRQEAYISASRLLGARTWYLVLRHMIPNTLGVVLVTLTFAVPNAIFTEAFLSFIGMGVAPPTASWGSMSNEGLATMLTHPHELMFPAIFISLTVLAFNLLGDGLRDALDVRMRSLE
ncbi:MAG: ABC transporter permease [Pseudomonadales bacterium]|nr:ABC transporter permease [Pseudomonadales bacterium]MCP5329701.1 ABC transporter permease [Pseudomonadales bacterium]MCP5343760.1 ABC transporter permease [Pseudomonadales bacterium]